MVQSTSSKRGLLRPGHGSGKLSMFVILALVVLTVLFLYNVYTNASTRDELQLEIETLRVKSHVCSKDKLEVEKKLELLTKQSKRKSMKDDEKLRLLKMANKEVNDQLTSQKEEVKKLTQQLADLQEAKNQLYQKFTELKANDEQQSAKNELTTQEFNNLTQNLDLLKRNETTLVNIIEKLKTENAALKTLLTSNNANGPTLGNSGATNDQTLSVPKESKTAEKESKIVENVNHSNPVDGSTGKIDEPTSQHVTNQPVTDEKMSRDENNDDKPVLNQPPLNVVSSSDNSNNVETSSSQISGVQNTALGPAEPPGPPGQSASLVSAQTQEDINNASLLIMTSDGFNITGFDNDNVSSSSNITVLLAESQKNDSTQNLGPVALPVPDRLSADAMLSSSNTQNGQNDDLKNKFNDKYPQKPGPDIPQPQETDTTIDKSHDQDGGDGKNADFDDNQPQGPNKGSFRNPDVSLKLKNKDNKAKEEYMYDDDDNNNKNNYKNNDNNAPIPVANDQMLKK